MLVRERIGGKTEKPDLQRILPVPSQVSWCLFCAAILCESVLCSCWCLRWSLCWSLCWCLCWCLYWCLCYLSVLSSDTNQPVAPQLSHANANTETITNTQKTYANFTKHIKSSPAAVLLQSHVHGNIFQDPRCRYPLLMEIYLGWHQTS